MAVYAAFSTMVNIYERQIQDSNFTKSDAEYHNIKQSLHNIWSKIYTLETSSEKTALTEKIQKCLAGLDKTAEKNEKKKYQKYYRVMKNNREMDVC